MPSGVADVIVAFTVLLLFACVLVTSVFADDRGAANEVYEAWVVGLFSGEEWPKDEGDSHVKS